MADGPAPLRLHLATPLWIWSARLLVRMSPLLGIGFMDADTAARPGTLWSFGIALVLWQGMWSLVEKRCASPDLGFGRGLRLVGAAMNTGWLWFDVLLVGLGVVVAHVAAMAIACFPDAPRRFRGMLAVFLRHRMEQ